MVVINRVGHTSVATLPSDCDAEVLANIAQKVAASAHAHADRRVVIDTSAISMLDPSDAAELAMMCHTLTLIGAEPMIAGLRPEVVAALVSMRVDFAGVECVLDLAAVVEGS